MVYYLILSKNRGKSTAFFADMQMLRDFALFAMHKDVPISPVNQVALF